MLWLRSPLDADARAWIEKSKALLDPFFRLFSETDTPYICIHEAVT